MTDKELMQQALSVLCNNVYPRDGVRDNRHLTPKSHAAIYQQTVDTLFDRLAQTEPGPVAWITKGGKGDLWWHRSVDENGNDNLDDVPLYMAPPQRQWVGLTKEELVKIWKGTPAESEYWFEFAKAIEVKLKEKNL